MKKIALVLLLLSSFQNVWAADQITAKVVYAGTYGDGRLFVGLDTIIYETGCEKSRFDVAAGHDQIDHWLSIAMAAAISGADIKVATSGCFAGFPTIDSTADTYFYISAL